MSISKSIISICTGICLDQGLIKSLDEPICHYIEEFDKGISPYHKLITIRHLLTMTSGIYWNGGIHYHSPMLEQLKRSSNWLEHLADIAMSDVPGMKFVYKEWDVILLAAVISKAARTDFFDVCNGNLYQPLEIESGRWWQSKCGVTYSIADNEVNQQSSNLSAKDLAKIGMLLLNGGVYKGKQIVSKEFVEQAITPSDCNQEYGFLWWLGENWYGGSGFGGQEIRVIPDKKIVIVMQAKISSRGKSYEDVMEYLLEYRIDGKIEEFI
jgi:CubicO group peptidase (beta-lactamase class C family)